MTIPTGTPAKVQLGSSALRKLKDFRQPKKGKDDQKWQDESIDFFNNIGELYSVIELTAKMVGACRLRAAEYNETGEVCETTDERVHRVMRAFVGPDQGQRMLLRKAALSLQVLGECFLLGVPYEGPAVEGGNNSAESLLYWEFVSPKEIRFEDAKVGGERKVFRNSEGPSKGSSFGASGAQDPNELPLDCYIARIHRSELCYSEQATSHLRAARTICRELLDLTDVVAAIANSRLNAGILYVPQEFSFGNNKDGWQSGDGSDDDDIDYLTDVLTEHLTAPVADHTDEAALVPLIMRGPAEHGDKIKWIQISRDLDEWAKDLRQELLSRLADALDVPREVMLGKGDLNHWTGYNIDSDLVSKHILPVGQLIAEFVASSYLRPMLEEFEGMTPEEACRFTVEFDAQAVVARHNEAQVADRLFTLGCIGKKALLRASGFSEADQPSPEEQAQMFLLNGIRNAPIQYRWAIPYVDIFDHLGINPAVASGLLDPEVIDNDGYIDIVKLLHGPDGLEKITDPTRPEDNPDGEAGEPYDPNARPSEAEEVDEVRDSNNSRNSRPPSSQAPQTPSTSIQQSARFELKKEILVEKLLTAADNAYVNAMTKAASRYVSRAKIRRQDGVVDKIKFMSTIGTTELEEIGLTAEELLDDAWVELKDRSRPWIRDLFAGQANESDLTNTTVLQLEANMHAFCLSNFHNEPRLRDRDMYVPVELIVDALEAGNAGKSTRDPNSWV